MHWVTAAKEGYAHMYGTSSAKGVTILESDEFMITTPFVSDWEKGKAVSEQDSLLFNLLWKELQHSD